MIRVDTSAIKATLMHDKLYSPKQYTLKLKDLLPAIIRQRIEGVLRHMGTCFSNDDFITFL